LKFKQLRHLCLSLPEVEERETWGEATFRVKDKIFAMGSPDAGFVNIKASLADQSGLVAMDPETFSPSAHTGRFGWVRAELAGLAPELADRLIKNAWRLTAPKRLLAKLDQGR
jgi:hypothetical protein